jgi:hypothetical protein
LKVVTPRMHLASRRAFWSTVLAVAVLVSFCAVLGLAAPVTHATTTSRAASATTAFAPTSIALPAAGNASGAIVITSPIPVYMTLPFALTWTQSFVNATLANTTVGFSLTYLVDGAVIVNSSLAGANLFNASTPNSGSLSITNAVLTGGWSTGYANGQLLEGSYLLSVWMTVFNASQVSPAVFFTSAGAGTQLSAHLPSGKFFNPTANATVPQGALTISGEYNGSFLNGANITVTSSGTVVFFQGVFSPQTQPNDQEGFSVNWPATSGTYTVTLALSAPYGHTSVSETFTVSSQSSIVYINKTGSLSIAGLGPGGSAALLVVIGIIVGELAGFLLGRRSSTAAPGPAQPWSSQAAAPATTAANECPVCHQTFGTADELKEHSKTQHGITM